MQTCLYNVDKKTMQLSYVLSVPSEGDNAYGGVAYTKTDLYISYYSTFGSKSAIYVAKIPFSDLQ